MKGRPTLPGSRPGQGKQLDKHCQSSSCPFFTPRKRMESGTQRDWRWQMPAIWWAQPTAPKYPGSIISQDDHRDPSLPPGLESSQAASWHQCPRPSEEQPSSSAQGLTDKNWLWSLETSTVLGSTNQINSRFSLPSFQTNPLCSQQVSSDYSHEVKRCLLLGRKIMTNPDSVLKSRDITLPTTVCIVKVMVFLVVMYGYESWAIKMAECWRIHAFERWYWRRLLRVLG